MSTTFGIIDKVTGKTTKVARRVGISTGESDVTITALGELSLFILKNMAQETEVVAMDNSSQGIHTIGDIINHSGFVEIDWDLISISDLSDEFGYLYLQLCGCLVNYYPSPQLPSPDPYY